MIPLAVVAALPSAALAQPFGRFGYHPIPQVPGFILEKDGFRANWPTADKIRFNHVPKRWNIAETSDLHQVIIFDGQPGNMQKMRVDLLGPGFSLYCPKGIALKVASTQAPYLSWDAGTVSSGVPTPDIGWAALSFGDAQPPLLFGLPGPKASFVVTGVPGAWVVRSDNLDGWLRVGLPMGIRPIQANTARSLGELTQAAARVAPWFVPMPPEFRSLELETDPHSVVAKWTFSKPGAVVPPALYLSSFAGYSPTILSPVETSDAPTEEGPVWFSTTDRLQVRFPARRVPPGRALTIGTSADEPIGTVSAMDIPSVVQLALENLVASQDSQTRAMSESAISEYLSSAAYVAEPHTSQKLPFAASGAGIDIAAAHALLGQSVASAFRPTNEPNALLASVSWRLDWYTLSLRTDDSAVGRRAAAFASIAGILSPDPNRKLVGAMLHTGLQAEHGLPIWRKRRALPGEATPLLEVLPSLRKALFLGAADDDDGRFGLSLLSPLRLFGTTPAQVVREGEILKLRWRAVEPKPGVVILASGSPLKVERAQNLSGLTVETKAGITEIRFVPETEGICEATLQFDASDRLPNAVAVPIYRETVR